MTKDVHVDDSIAIGYRAAEIAASALEELGRAMIKQKALDVARQIEIYISCHHFASLEDIKRDPELASIAVTRVGSSGFTAIHDTDSINIFHHDPAVLGKDLRRHAFDFPQFWKIIQDGLTHDADGYYDWPEIEGQVQRKYMYCAPLFPACIAPAGLVVAATISIAEFLQPSREIGERIVTLAERVDEVTRRELYRNDQLRSINRLSRKISAYLDAEELLPYVAKSISETFRIQCVRISLYSGQPPVLLPAAHHCQYAWNDQAATDAILHPCIAETVAITGKPYLSARQEPSAGSGVVKDRPVRMVVPIRVGRTVLGVLDLVNTQAGSFGDIDLFTIWPVADQVATALENARLHRELRELAIVDERNRIAREIHDTLAQGFAGISMLTELAKRSLHGGETEHVEETLDRIRQLAKDKLSDARRSVQSLRPNIVIQENLPALVREELSQLAKDTPIETSLAFSGDELPMAQEVKLAALRICQETLHNIQKHAYAPHVAVAVAYEPDAVFICIQDDGVGFDPRTTSPASFGLTVMRERARQVGGSVFIESQVGAGTRVEIRLPLQATRG